MTPETKRNIFKWAVYLALVFVVSILQMTPNLFPAVFGARPVLLIPLTVCIAMFEGEAAGMTCGIVGGLLWDATGSRLIGFNSILMLLFALACAMLIEYLMSRRLVTAMLFCSSALVLWQLIDWLCFHVLPGYGSAGYTLLVTGLPVVGYSFLFVFPFYFLVRWMSERLNPQDDD
ncbi:MAG: rod shape-determining protein MreD [Clostridiales bacterium]|nr:rod shape-determining protein MreD [Clostridiales bacterium]